MKFRWKDYGNQLSEYLYSDIVMGEVSRAAWNLDDKRGKWYAYTATPLKRLGSWYKKEDAQKAVEKAIVKTELE